MSIMCFKSGSRNVILGNNKNNAGMSSANPKRIVTLKKVKK